MTTEEGNKIIALYDGWEWESEEWDGIYKIQDGYYYSMNELHENMTIEESEYHNNWNWLIPVVKKVKAEPIDNRSLIAALTNLEIEPLWQATIEDIQLINKYK